MEKLNIGKRQKNCNHYAKKTRMNGKIPGILYGKNFNNYMFEVSEIELNQSMKKSGEHGVLDVLVNGENCKALIKEVQREPVNHKVIHIDLERILENQRIHTEVPINFTGEGAVNSKGGILQKEKNSLKIECNVNNIPQNITLDLSKLDTGDTLRVGDVEFAEDISFMEPLDSVILTVVTNAFVSEDHDGDKEDDKKE